MINNTFSSARFWNYFVYDLKQLWRNNGKAVILLGFLSLITYLLWVTFSLIFTGAWHAPGIAARAVIFYVGALILVLYNTRTYGYLTEKHAGSAWLMIPASTLEKFVSMMIITVIVLPLAYVASFLLLDGAITLLDPSAGNSLITGAIPSIGDLNRAVSEVSETGLDVNLGLLALPLILQLVANFLYFLLCGICFKKWKLVGAFAIILGIQIVFMPIISGLALHRWAPYFENLSASEDPVAIINLINTAMNWGTILDVLLILGFGWGIYYRLKNLKH